MDNKEALFSELVKILLFLGKPTGDSILAGDFENLIKTDLVSYSEKAITLNQKGTLKRGKVEKYSLNR